MGKNKIKKRNQPSNGMKIGPEKKKESGNRRVSQSAARPVNPIESNSKSKKKNSIKSRPGRSALSFGFDYANKLKTR